MSPAPSLCLFFQAHQPLRLKSYDFFQIGEEEDYFDHETNLAVLNRVCDQSYLPACALFERLSEESSGRLCFGLGLSGTLLEQLEEHRPEVLAAFQRLVEKEIAFLTSGTFSHSLASFYSTQELSRQIQLHRKILWRLFRKRPRTFANTELIYRDDAAKMIHSYGFTTALVEGVPQYLGYRSPNYLYSAAEEKKVKLLLRNGGLSDDLGFRFSDTNWSEHPLRAERFLEWVLAGEGPVRNLFLDLETIGEHQKAETGIFQFWEAFINQALQKGVSFDNPSKVIKRFKPVGDYSSPRHSSWADQEKDKSAWQKNVMQLEASQKLFRLQHFISAAQSSGLTRSWTHLQAADHFLHMSTKEGPAGEVHRYFSPYADPYDAYLTFMNILSDLQIRARTALAQPPEEQKPPHKRPSRVV